MSATGATMSPRGSALLLRARRVEGPPVVALRLWLWGGSRVESLAGLAWVTGRMLTEGSLRRDWRRIAEDGEDRGMDLTSSGGLEAHGIGIDCLERDWPVAVEWLAELVGEPSFPPDRCAWQCRQGRAELQSLRDEPDSRSEWAFAKHLYSPHAAGRPLPSTAADLVRIEAAACRRFHDEALARGGVLAVAGAIDEDAVAAAVERCFGRHGGGARLPAPPVPEPVGLAARRRRVATTATDQAHLLMGHLTVRRADPDLAALELGSVVLGASSAGLTGRIPVRVREREGLAYSAFASAVAGAGLDRGRLLVHIATSSETVARAEAVVREELDRLLEGGLMAGELEEARSYLLRREPFRRETPQQWAELMAQSELYGLPYDDPGWSARAYGALDREAVESALRRHLHPERIKVTIGAPRARASRGA